MVFNKNPVTRVKIIYVLTSLFLAALSIYAFLQIKNLIDSSNHIGHTHEVTACLLNVSSLVKDAEANQTHFLLTSDKLFLLKKDIVLSELNQSVNLLDTLFKDNPSQLENLNILKEIIIEKNQNSTEILFTYKLHGLGTDLRKKMLDGIQKMNHLKGVVNEMIVIENKSMENQTGHDAQLSFITVFFIVFLFLGALCILFAAYININNALENTKHTQAKFEAEKLLAETILDASTDLIAMYDVDTRFVYFSKACEKLYGKKREDVIGKKLLDVFPQTNNSQAYFDLLSAIKGHTIHNEVFFSPIWNRYYENFLIPLKNNDDKIYGVLAIAHDNTDIFKAKDELKEINEELLIQNEKLEERNAFVETLINSSPELIMVLDIELCIITVNKQAEKIFNSFYNGNIIGAKITDINPALLNTQPYHDLIKAFEGQIVICDKIKSTFSNTYYKHSFIPLKNSEIVYAVMIISNDITSQIAAEQNILESEEKFNKLFQFSPFGITLTEIPTGIIIDVNEHYLKTFGFTREEMIGKTNLELNLIDPINRQKIHDAVTKKGNVKNVEIEVRKKNGEKIPVIVSIETISVGDKKYFLNAINDIVEIRNAEAEVNRSNQLLQEMNRELESFAYVSSHDLQEPLRKIQTFSSSIMEKEIAVLSEDGKNKFRRIQDAVVRMQRLIDDLLAYSRMRNDKQSFEETDPNKIIDEIKGDLREELAQKNATIETSKLCKMHIIPFQFRQLMQNLISNALKFTRPDVPPDIIIKSENIKGSEENNGLLNPHQSYCHITVEDNGIGFPSEFNHKIFELFQRLHTRDQYKGTGIGLAIVKKIVENHKGVITARAVENKGATFDIYIPFSNISDESESNNPA